MSTYVRTILTIHKVIGLQRSTILSHNNFSTRATRPDTTQRSRTTTTQRKKLQTKPGHTQPALHFMMSTNPRNNQNSDAQSSRAAADRTTTRAGQHALRQLGNRGVASIVLPGSSTSASPNRPDRYDLAANAAPRNAPAGVHGNVNHGDDTVSTRTLTPRRLCSYFSNILIECVLF